MRTAVLYTYIYAYNTEVLEAMKQAKHDCQIKYAKENQQTSKQKNRKRNIIWYNPPFNNQVSTNIGKEFFKFLRKYFPKEDNFNKLFNRNDLEISYWCTRNIKQIINHQSNHQGT